MFSPPRMMTSLVRPTISMRSACERGEVAGAEPSVGGERVLVVGGIEIAHAHLGAAHEQFAVGRDLQFGRGDRESVGENRRRFRGSVRALHPRAEPRFGLFDERGADARAAARDQSQGRDPRRFVARRVHQPPEERRRTDHERDLLRRDDLERAVGIPPRHQDAAERDRARKRDPVQQAADVRARRRHQDAVVRAESVGRAHDRGLVRERRLRVQHALRRAARSGRPQHGGQLLRFGPAFGHRRARAGARRDRARRSVGRPPARVRLRRPRPGGAPVRRSRRCASTRDRRGPLPDGWVLARRPRRPERRRPRAARRRRPRPRLAAREARRR